MELLVGKTIHVSMLELMQEEELAAIRRQQDEFEAIRNVELAEVQRMEAEAGRKVRERYLVALTSQSLFTSCYFTSSLVA